MKRILSILSGAIVGLVGLPLMTLVCIMAAPRFCHLPIALLPNYFVFVIFTDGHPLLITSPAPKIINSFFLETEGRACIYIGAALGAWSVVLWRGGRTFGPRFGSALFALGIGAYLIWRLAEICRYDLGLFWLEVFMDTPIILWVSAILFFALLLRPRAAALHS